MHWGKRDEDLILPINSSLSVTLHQDQVRSQGEQSAVLTTKRRLTSSTLLNRILVDCIISLFQLKSTTTVACSARFKEDRIWLNGKEENINQPRLQSCLREIRRLVRKRRSNRDPGADVLSLSHKVHICSENNFPTAAGLASSAAGYACL
ncbi:hypothetical protein Z043_124621, partial [Scleropages formosus]